MNSSPSIKNQINSIKIRIKDRSKIVGSKANKTTSRTNTIVGKKEILKAKAISKTNTIASKNVGLKANKEIMKKNMKKIMKENTIENNNVILKENKVIMKTNMIENTIKTCPAINHTNSPGNMKMCIMNKSQVAIRINAISKLKNIPENSTNPKTHQKILLSPSGTRKKKNKIGNQKNNSTQKEKEALNKTTLNQNSKQKDHRKHRRVNGRPQK